MAKVITLASPKGGSGKTMVCGMFGATLAGLGYKVLLIDSDSATNGLTLLFLPEVSEERDAGVQGLFDGFEGVGNAEPIWLRDGLALVPATTRFADTELTPYDLFEQRLSEIVRTSRKEFDFILIDAQAGSDPAAAYAMSRPISDEVVIVSEYDPMSAAGVERLKALLPDQLGYDRTWVLLNKLLPEFVEHFREFLSVSRYLSPIPWDAEAVRAYARRELPIDLETGNEFTLAVMQSLRSLLGSEFADRFDTWRSSKEASIKQPLKDQRDDLKRELQSLYEVRARLESMRNIKVNTGRAAVVALTILTVAVLPEFLLRLFPGTIIAGDLGWIIGGAVAALVVGIFAFTEIVNAGRKGKEAAKLAFMVDRIDEKRERLKELENLLAASADELVSKQRNF